MPDTGAPWNIPYVENADLVRDWPADSLLVANAVAAGLSAATNPGIGSNVVSVTKTDTFSQGSVAGGASVAVTGLSVTITPTSATSKVLVLVSLNGSNSDSNVYGSTGISVMRGATQLAPADVGNRPGHTSGNLQSSTFGTSIGHVSAALVDSPATTSATTYSVEVVNMSSASATVHVNRSASDADSVNSLRTYSSITVIEVAA